jgi:hypothetical protein
MQPKGNGKKMPFIYEKFLSMVKKRNEEGGYPRTRLEENMARDFRLCRDDVRRIFAELKIGNLEDDYQHVKKKRTRCLPEYSQKTEDDFLNELGNYRG